MVTADTASHKPIVEFRGITKRFGALVANDNVDLVIEEGSIHAVVGENGAGKTTLMLALYGAHQVNSGEIYLRGKPIRFMSPRQAISAGVGMVTQHYSIIPALSVIDNLMLGSETTIACMLNRKTAIEKADALAKTLGFEFNWHALAQTLSPALSQKLEILKLLWRSADILILDEPTAMLSPSDSDALFENLKSLVQGSADGKKRTAIIVTHKLREVMQYAQSVTILRGGKKIATAPVKDVSIEQLTSWIVGEALVQPSVSANTPSGNRSILQVENLCVDGSSESTPLRNISFEINEGEIVGIAGVDGNGQTELVETLIGLRKPSDGRLLILDKDITPYSTFRRMNECGIRYLPEDRHRRAVIEDWSVSDNAILGFQRDPALKTGMLISKDKVKARTLQLIKDFNVKTTSIASPLRSLSGGNQQRLVAARTFSGNPKLLIAFQPTRGLDIRGSEQIYTAIRKLCSNQGATLVVSFDLDELLGLCHKIVVLYRGQVFGSLQGELMTRENIGALMVGRGLA